MTSVIYLIDKGNGKFYVGSTFSSRFERRMSEHKIKSKGWKVTIIEECEDEARFDKEGSHIDRLKSAGINLTNKPDPRKSFPNHILRGGKRSEESIRKSAEGHRGKPNKGGLKAKGRKRSQETIEKISNSKRGMTYANKGRPLTESHRQAMIESWKKRKQLKLQEAEIVRDSGN